MKHIVLITAIFFCSILTQAQSKKDLLFEIENLETKFKATEAELLEMKRNEATNLAKVASYEAQLEELRVTNSTLMGNLNRIMEESSKRTDDIGKSLENIQQKERQLRFINDAMTTTDSTAVVIITDLKKALGEDARLSLSNGMIAVILDDISLFGEKDTSHNLNPAAHAVLEKVASVLKMYPQHRIAVQSKSNALNFENTGLAGNWELSALKAAAVAGVLEKQYELDPKRIQAIGVPALGFDSIETSTEIRILPGYDTFYQSVKANLKNY